MLNSLNFGFIVSGLMIFLGLMADLMAFMTAKAPPCSDVASFLECQEDSPALCLSRYTYSGDKVVTFVQMWHDGATFRFDGTIG